MVTLAMFHDKPGVNFVLWTVSEARNEFLQHVSTYLTREKNTSKESDRVHFTVGSDCQDHFATAASYYRTFVAAESV